MNRLHAIAIAFLLLFGTTKAASARIGDTLEQCVARYGQPTRRAANGMIFFEKSGFVVGVRLYDGRVDTICFFKPQTNVVDAHAPISDNEVELLLKANGQGKEWQKVDAISTDEMWSTPDLALFATHTILDPAVTIQTKEAVARDQQATKNDEQKKLEAF